MQQVLGSGFKVYGPPSRGEATILREISPTLRRDLVKLNYIRGGGGDPIGWVLLAKPAQHANTADPQ